MTKLNLIEMRTHQVHVSVCQNHPINVNLTLRLHVDILCIHCPFCGFLAKLWPKSVLCGILLLRGFFVVAVQNVLRFV